MPGGAARGELEPGHALLGGLDEIEALAPDGGAEPSDLPDGLGAALELVAVLLDQELGAGVPAGLLVRGEAQPDRPVGEPAGALAVPDHRQEHRVEVLHVDRAAAPQVAVLDLAGERVDLPVLGGGRYDVEVAVQEEREPSDGPQCATREVRPGADS